MDKIQVFKPAHSEEEVEAVAEVIRSGWWGQGPKTAELETKFAEFVGSPLAVSVKRVWFLIGVDLQGGTSVQYLQQAT